MMPERHSIPGDNNTLDLNKYRYIGHHREYELPKGVGLIPHGSRTRVKPEYGTDYLEERDSIDKYTKYIT